MYTEDQKEKREKFNKKYGSIINKEQNVKAFKYKWFDCVLLRVLWHINWYVGIPNDHPFYGMNYYYSNWDNRLLWEKENYINQLHVHWWLTYANNLKLVEIDWYDFSWCFWFDTAHGWDAFDGWSFIMYDEWRDEYRTQEYVENEVKELVDQILLFPIVL